jgi:hypothetical protein
MGIFKAVSRRDYVDLLKMVEDANNELSLLKRKTTADRARISSLERRLIRVERAYSEGEDTDFSGSEEAIDNGTRESVEERRLRIGRGEPID